MAEGVVLRAGDGVCALLGGAAEDKAMAASSSSEGVVGGVWKKSKGEPERWKFEEKKKTVLNLKIIRH